MQPTIMYVQHVLNTNETCLLNDNIKIHWGLLITLENREVHSSDIPYKHNISCSTAAKLTLIGSWQIGTSAK